jgi:predicted TIM-barrel fold metal-dependent hydrolase
MRKGFQIFDTHTHLGVARHSGRSCHVDQMLAHMDRMGVDRSLLIPFPVVEDYRSTHDTIGAAIRAHPDRFCGAACLNPFVSEDEFRGELQRCAEELGFRAVKLQPQYQALNPLSTRSEFFFEAALAHRLAVVVHTGAGAPFALPSLYIVPARKFPELRIVLGHAGGGIYAGEAIVAAMVCPNIFVELSSLMPHHVREVLGHLDSSRLMIGSDLPESVETEIGKIEDLDVTAEVKHDILWRTGRRVFDGAGE